MKQQWLPLQLEIRRSVGMKTVNSSRFRLSSAEAVSNNDELTIILITNLMHCLLFIHKILYSSTCFEPQVLIFRRVQLYTCSIWYCHSSWWPVGTQLSLTLCTDRPPRTVTVPYAACIQLYPPEDEHLRFETCKGK